MTQNTIKHESWLKRYWKWFVPSIVVIGLVIIFFSSGINKVTSDLTKAYTDTELFNNALKKVKTNETVISILGSVHPIDQLAILEGQVNYSKANTSVKSSIRISGTKGNARLDIIANKVNNEWHYKTINVRIKNPKDQQQTITVLKTE